MLCWRDDQGILCVKDHEVDGVRKEKERLTAAFNFFFLAVNLFSFVHLSTERDQRREAGDGGGLRPDTNRLSPLLLVVSLSLFPPSLPRKIKLIK